MNWIDVFSTCVEVIPIRSNKTADILGILHVCGGDPCKISHNILISVYSPRVWRWSFHFACWLHNWKVFSTCVEVILGFTGRDAMKFSILHVCGGDPLPLLVSTIYLLYSPRVWRWSPAAGTGGILITVFSTCVEVIPLPVRGVSLRNSILHVCGGDPVKTVWLRYEPRVFSTCVEVILPLTNTGRVRR